MASSRAVTSTSDPAFGVDPDGIIVAWNRAAERALGYPAAQVLNKRCSEVLQGRDGFGNLYCVDGCPLLAMARRRQPIGRCRISFKTNLGTLQEFSVATLLLSDRDGRGERLLHLLGPALPLHEPGAGPPRRRDLAPNHRRGPLTPREREVLVLLAEGRETAEIAELLCISPTTVANHIQHILHKLHVRRRLHAVLVGQRLGLLGRPGEPPP